MLTQLRDRFYSDFLLGSRLSAYAHLIESALDAGYRVSSVGGIWRQITERGLDPGHRFLVLRHDVDTDPGTAAAMLTIDRRFGVESSYFFRLSTLHLPLMAGIAAAGSEASYHYEELATIAKRRRLRSRSAAVGHLPEARDAFAENITRLRAATGLPMRVVASHGDFVNRQLGLPNWTVLDDRLLRERLDIELETYDEAFLQHLTSRHSDAPHPRYWQPMDPLDAIHAGRRIISVLVHPRHWRANVMVNARDDVRRAVEGLRFAMPF